MADKLYFAYGSNINLEQMDYRCPDATVVGPVVLENYGLTLEDAYVFGDSTNDIAMFEHVPNAVLMGRHSPELEPYASFLTKTVEQDGIWYAMEKLGLLNEEV
jgi:3-deoxy-D-manno-octulosonate 8-phosphate phosphatase KdsC-like HAD superfamily phosphatase